MKRLVPGAAAAAVVLALAACSAVDPEAVHIGSVTVSQRQLDRELQAFVKDPAARRTLEAVSDPSRPPFVQPGTDGKVTNSRLSDVLINLEIRNAASRKLIASAGIADVPPMPDADAANLVFGNAELLAVWKELSPSLRARWAQGLADVDALRAHISGPEADDAAKEAFHSALQPLLPTLTLDDLKRNTVQPMDDQTWSQLLDAALTSVANGLGVRVDPKYGTWDPARGLLPASAPIAGQVAATQSATA